MDNDGIEVNTILEGLGGWGKWQVRSFLLVYWIRKCAYHGYHAFMSYDTTITYRQTYLDLILHLSHFKEVLSKR